MSFFLPFLLLFLVNAQASNSFRSGREGFVRKDGSQLVLNGEPFYVAGWNTYYLLDCAHQDHFYPRGKRVYPGRCPATDEVLEKGKSLGLNVLRTWAFHDGRHKGKHPLQVSAGKYGEHTFQMLDYTVFKAGIHGIKLILPFVDFVGAYGGALQYLKWSRNRRFRKTRFSDRELFYTDPHCKAMLKNHIKAVLLRRNVYTNLTYREDPAILAWELANEPRAPFDTSGDALQAWIQEMAGFVRSLDDKHLIALGSEGWFGQSDGSFRIFNPPTVEKQPVDWNVTEGSDFIRNHNDSNIDIATFRLWNHWLPDGTTNIEQRAFWRNWVSSHLQASKEHLNKPVLLEEFGVRHAPVPLRDEYFKLVYKLVESGIQDGSPVAGSCFWMLSDDAYPDYDGFTVYIPAHETTGAIISDHTEHLRSLAAQAEDNSGALLHNLISAHLTDSSLAITLSQHPAWVLVLALALLLVPMAAAWHVMRSQPRYVAPKDS